MSFHVGWYDPEPVLWPALDVWQAILRGASLHAGLDARHTLLCHLARRVKSFRHLDDATARKFVRTRIAAHVESVVLEFGFTRHDAHAIAQRVYTWLEQLQEAPTAYVPAVWPTPSEWLRIDRGAAMRIGLDPELTLSTNIGCILVAKRRMSLKAAKRHVHARIASHAAQLTRELGFGVIASIVVSVRMKQWLDSFDHS